ncbi:Cobyrinate a,c-diamide synthase [Methanimicrococcus sp. At1]|uniref:Cobyrinate a,c-diamide synthase n=1 Tax=Methanimicrococcus hacksteinii TaxID=3028293 RepID=A0ABU3VRX7_9EURY|nr:cobyrinate a,c-diamide synthase [Methanimicrococcus sp. At1]MDV0446034.1 Cobyrinate a,c-diamide synthase [Methanimicrococcus sp. At1]
MTKGFLIAATNSGVGKTTSSMGLMAALKKRGKAVQGFKTGPDYIDPAYHAVISGRPSYNLDTYMMGTDAVVDQFMRASKGSDISIVEGVMGLFDGMDSTEISGAAHVAKTLDIPVFLVINTHGMSRSTAAMLKGFAEFDPDVHIAGVILNKIGSPRHLELIKGALDDKIPIVGALPRNPDIAVPERYMGLHLPEEKDLDYSQLAEFIEENMDIDLMLQIAADYEKERPEPEEIKPKETDVTIGIAREPSFCFHYPAMFDAFRNAGAHLEFFSPTAGELPEADGYYFASGYPEFHIKELSESSTTKKLKDLAADGVPMFGEGAGLSYLCESYETEDGTFKMAGILPAESRITKRLQGLGYAEAKPLSSDFGTKNIRAHEFHYSVTDPSKDAEFAYEMLRGKGIADKKDGLHEYNVLAGYMQMHPGSFPIEDFVEKCRVNKRK